MSFITISGNIAVGKTSLVRKLVNFLNSMKDDNTIKDKKINDKNEYENDNIVTSHIDKYKDYKVVIVENEKENNKTVSVIASVTIAEEFSEPVYSNPYLEKFYLDKKRWSFHMEVFLLNVRYRQHLQILKIINNIQNNCCQEYYAIQDRSVYEDTVFVKALYELEEIDETDYTTYMDLFQNMVQSINYPDIIVYLRASPETCLKRIKQRGRNCEQNIDLKYLSIIHKYYDELMTKILPNYVKVLIIDWEEFKSEHFIWDKIISFMNK